MARGPHTVAARLPLERVAEAHELVEQGRATGNVVLAVGDAGGEEAPGR
jgi:NADPH:quinone reductase